MSKKIDTAKNREIINKLRTHYVFNVLWNIQYLYKTDPKQAERMLINFSTFFRGKVNDLCYDGMLDFEDEFEQTRAYVEMEQVRTTDHINFVKNFQFIDFRIPCLVIQPLVENAIKHGIYPKEAEGEIRISTKKIGSKVLLEISDDGVGFDIKKVDRERAGNIFEIEGRMRDYYPDATVTYDSIIGKGTKVSILFTY